MEKDFIEIRIKGKNTRVPCCHIDGKAVIVRGKWIRTASVHDEEWMKGAVVTNPDYVVAQLKKQGLPADVFTFAQKPPETKPKFDRHFDWDNFAVIHIKSYDDWWESLPQESRKNTRRSAKRGVTVRRVEVDDALIQGITEIYNETPIRQGKRFPHYGKDFATVKNETCTLLDRSEFIGAYHGNELIGFIKLVCLGEVASILHINSKNAHYDKRPTNILMAKAVEICSQKGIAYLLYGRYIYGKKTSSPLVEFKKRNGFQKMEVPRYYIPLTLWGRVVVALRLYRGLLGLLPSSIVNFLVTTRSRFFERASAKGGEAEKLAATDRDKETTVKPVGNSHPANCPSKRVENVAEA
jgi:hypothetical protein